MITRIIRRAVPVKEVSDQKPRVPLEVYILLVHAQDALAKGDIECATTRLELALRRCER
jgi:cellobiose-specific phosphotransferase system component IIA